MNSPAGKTGLTTHEVLWADFCRSTTSESVPAAALEFRFGNPLGMDKYKLAERKGGGKALDELCESLGSAADPGRQTWRGIRNTNLSRFDKPRALDAVRNWADALAQLKSLVKRFTAATTWTNINSIQSLRSVIANIASLPPPDERVEEALLSLTLEGAAAASLERWSSRAIEAHELDGEIEQVCSKTAFEEQLGTVDNIYEQAAALQVFDQTIEALPNLRSHAIEAARSSAEHSQLLDQIFALTRAEQPDEWTTRTETMLVATARLSKSLPEKLFRYRSVGLAESSVIDDLEAAKQAANRANNAAAQAKLEPNAAITATAAQLREAASILISTGLFGRLFSSNWREAKRLWNSLFPVEKKISPEVAGNRLIAAAEWKDASAALDAAFIAKEVAGRHWSGASTPFDSLIVVAQWMKAVRDVTPLGEVGSKEMRKHLCEGNSDDLTPIWELADMIAQTKVAETVAEYGAKRTTVHAATNALRERAASLDALIREAQALVPRPNVTIQRLQRTKAAVIRARECREWMTRETTALAATQQMQTGADADKAVRIRATIAYANQVKKASLPESVARSLLREGCSERLSSWKEASTEINSLLAVEAASRGTANDLLKIDATDWCGAAFDEADLGFVDQGSMRCGGTG